MNIVCIALYTCTHRYVSILNLTFMLNLTWRDSISLHLRDELKSCIFTLRFIAYRWMMGNREEVKKTDLPLHFQGRQLAVRLNNRWRLAVTPCLGLAGDAWALPHHFPLDESRSNFGVYPLLIFLFLSFQGWPDYCMQGRFNEACNTSKLPWQRNAPESSTRRHSGSITKSLRLATTKLYFVGYALLK